MGLKRYGILGPFQAAGTRKSETAQDPRKTGVPKRDREPICGKESNSHALNPDDPGQSE